MRLLLEIALTHIRGRARQTVVSVAGVTLGVGFAIGMAALMQGSQDEFVTTLIDAMPHVQITDETRTPRTQPAERIYGAVEIHGLKPRDDPRGILNPVEAMTGLRSWVPGAISAGLRVSGVARYGGTDRGVSILGIEPADELQVSKVAEDIIAGGLSDLVGGGFAAVIGDSLAERLGAGMGDSIRLSASTGVARNFKIVGLFHTGVVATDETLVYVRLKSAQVLAGRQNAVNDIRIRLGDPDAAPAVAARAEELLGLKAVSWQEANESILEAFAVRNIIMYTVVAAILVVAGFGIFNIVSIITHEKARDIAILKSIGFRERDVRIVFMAEGAVMGGLGGALGALLGAALTAYMGTIEFEFREATEVTHLPVTWNWIHYAIAASLALVTAALAGYLPARKAAQGNPVDIIRGAT
ncbi:ABC transporter permease [Limibaculum sp. FT325]|uniref:ABC transporter permease n=1 Tax=Thermohalobaculum sediminis TaxID=2939436 RepID=UPI0020C100FE|nr:ABC transporter permease [Limibaculum sediminis]MCL5776379.1 ABC transporter permease [Limibaculum sediminis]